MSTPNGVGASVLRAILATTVTVKWNPDLSVAFGADAAQGVSSVDVEPAGAGGNTLPIIVFTFQGASGTLPRTSSVRRTANTFASTSDNTGFTANLGVM